LTSEKEIPIITYSRKWFNPLFFIIEDIIENKPKVKRILAYGGKSSSKTVSFCQYIAKSGIEENNNAILFRKESARVKSTIKKSFKKAIETTRLTEAWTTLDRQFKSSLNTEVILTGLDSDDKVKGIEDYNFLLYDELDQFDKSEYTQGNLSLRGEGKRVLFATWNPISKKSWVKKELVDTYQWNPTKYELPNENSFVKISSCGTTILIKTNYKDNYWTVGSPCGTYGYLDSNLIDDYEGLKESDPNAYSVNVLGNWGNVNTGGEFYKGFNYNINVSKHNYNKDLPLHISFDENVNPYTSLSIYQGEGSHVWKINEICLEHPFNTLRFTVDKFKKMYPINKLKVFLYGDRTSLKADSKLEKGQNYFTLIDGYLKGYVIERRLPTKNPSVHLRGLFINDMLLGLLDIKYTIDENCVNTIDDYQNVKEAPDGTKHKTKKKHPVTKITYEEYGHLTDTDDYFLCEYFKDEYAKYSGVKKFSMTSIGTY